VNNEWRPNGFVGGGGPDWRICDALPVYDTLGAMALPQNISNSAAWGGGTAVALAGYRNCVELTPREH